MEINTIRQLCKFIYPTIEVRVRTEEGNLITRETAGRICKSPYNFYDLGYHYFVINPMGIIIIVDFKKRKHVRKHTKNKCSIIRKLWKNKK